MCVSVCVCAIVNLSVSWCSHQSVLRLLCVYVCVGDAQVEECGGGGRGGQG